MANNNLLPNNPTLTDFKDFIKKGINVNTEEEIFNITSPKIETNINTSTSITTINFNNTFLFIKDKQARDYIESLTTEMPSHYDVRNLERYNPDKQYARQENQWVEINQQSSEAIATIGDNININGPLRQMQFTSGDYAVENIISAEFSEARQYYKNDIVLYEHKLYSFINSHNGIWSSTDVEELNIANIISKKANKIIPITGTIGPNNGIISNNKISNDISIINYHITSPQYFKNPNDIKWTANNGSISFSTENLSGSTKIELYLSEVEE